MKPGYTSLKKLTDKSKSKGFRLKVKITHKGPATTSPSKRRFQRLVVRDDEGNTMKATLFENDIDIYAEALKRNGEYELTDVAVKPLPPAYRTRTDEEYQLCLGGRMRIRTLNLSDVDEEPKYRLLSYVPPCMRDHEPLIDLAAVVIYVGNMREEMQDDYPKPVREILIADQSVSRPMKLIAKNRFAYDDISPFLKNWHETFQVVGFTGIRLYTYRDNMALLSDWRAKAMSIYSNESPKNIVAVSSVLSKKATTIWQDEFFWIAGSLSNLKDREIWSYTGCDSCGKKTSGELGVRFDCHACSAKNVSIELKLVLTTDISDHEATLKATIYSSVAEKMLGLSAAEFVALRKKGESTVEAKLQEVRQMKFLIKICPNHELTISNVLKWIVNSIEVVPPEFESDIRKTPMKGMAVATTECDAGLVDRQSKTGYSPAAGENFHTPVTSPTSVDHLGLCGLDVTVTPLASNPLVKDNTVTKQPVSPGGRPSNRKSRALRINMNNNSYAGIEDNESEASGMNASVSGLFENTALAGESQLDEE